MEPVFKLMGVMIAILVIPMVAFYVVPQVGRALARRLDPGGPADTAESAELVDLRERVAALESERERLAELEERLDFAERMLSQAREPARLPERGDA